MSDPWITIVGLGANGTDGLTDQARQAITCADIIFGGPRHLQLVGAGGRGQAWPIPFTIDPVLAHRGRQVVVLVSGDPFWFSAGSMIAESVGPDEWVAFPSPSTFSLVAASLGWRLEAAICHGLHAAPFARLRPDLQNGARLICLLRDGNAPGQLARYVTGLGFGASRIWIAENMGSPTQRLRETTCGAFDLTDISAPVAVAIDARGLGLSRASGRVEDVFRHDGQITKSPIRAMTLAALAPRDGEHLWDIGAGSGSVSMEWCLAAPRATATAIEYRADRVANIEANADGFGLNNRISVRIERAPFDFTTLAPADAVFVGGGATEELLGALWSGLAGGTRLVANSVTLETEALFTKWHVAHGGSLRRITISEAEPLGRMHGWSAARPVVQWSIVR